METHEIDLRLQRYTSAEHRIGANLQELEQHSVYQLLMTDELRGATAKALATVNQADPTLWELFTLLSSTLDRARSMRGAGSRVGNDDRLALADVLATPSVLIASEDIPLADRDLTGTSSRDIRITIEQLIDRMSGLYEPVRDVVSHAEQVLRDVLPRLNSAEATVGRLRSEAASLAVSSTDLDRLDETIAKVRELSLTDPLSIPADARSSFDEAIRAASAAIAQARSSHDELASDIAAASGLLDECRELIERAERTRSESLAKVSQPIGLRQPPSLLAIDGPNGLATKLKPILASKKRWQDVRNDLDIWSLAATRLHAQLTRVCDANGSPLKKRDELRGRLSAFRAKMAATGHSEDLVLRDLGAEAHNELYTSPTDLGRAERLVSEFGKRLATA